MRADGGWSGGDGESRPNSPPACSSYRRARLASAAACQRTGAPAHRRSCPRTDNADSVHANKRASGLSAPPIYRAPSHAPHITSDRRPAPCRGPDKPARPSAPHIQTPVTSVWLQLATPVYYTRLGALSLPLSTPPHRLSPAPARGAEHATKEGGRLGEVQAAQRACRQARVHLARGGARARVEPDEAAQNAQHRAAHLAVVDIVQARESGLQRPRHLALERDLAGVRKRRKALRIMSALAEAAGGGGGGHGAHRPRGVGRGAQQPEYARGEPDVAESTLEQRHNRGVPPERGRARGARKGSWRAARAAGGAVGPAVVVHRGSSREAEGLCQHRARRPQIQGSRVVLVRREEQLGSAVWSAL